MLLKLTPSSQRPPVLVRVFGDHTDEVIDRESEETISLQLHEAGFGAEVKQHRTHQCYAYCRYNCFFILQILGTFVNGRVESWIHMRPLKPEEMCERGNAACIARRLADFHAADIKGVSRKPQVFQRILKWYTLSLMRFQHRSSMLLPFAHLYQTYLEPARIGLQPVQMSSLSCKACHFDNSIQYNPLALCLPTCCKITCAVHL